MLFCLRVVWEKLQAMEEGEIPPPLFYGIMCCESLAALSTTHSSREGEEKVSLPLLYNIGVLIGDFGGGL